MADAVSILAQGVLAEAKHLFYLIILRYGSVLRKIFIWDQFLDETTFRRGPPRCAIGANGGTTTPSSEAGNKPVDLQLGR